MQGKHAATRATTDGTWEKDDKVQISVKDSATTFDGVNIDANGKVILNDIHFRWKKHYPEKEIYAHYPVELAKEIMENQSNEGYQKSDYLFASQIRITISSSNKEKTLVFRHLPAKVVVHLNAGNGVTEEELKAATVTFENLNRKWGKSPDEETGHIDQVIPGTDRIIPNEVTPAADGYVRTVRALFVPQDMSGRKLVKIVTAAGKTFYYIPTKGEADFFNGKMYEYRLTVASVGVTNSTVEGGTWQPAD
ncbi:fimbrillin family protein [uncultured Bacteroides sp.]|uniref:fimbrillin family protein n=1 Tax=uncultured Bacteroides sp. TaxID=162156 RepID=UPI0025ED375A|nr:fimbrillin family protein [uncultured Bacteroides sp.]